MRKKARRTNEQAAWDLLAAAPAVHLASTTPDGAPLVRVLNAALAPGGHAIIATFALDGPERCSGLPVVRYAPRELAQAIGAPFTLVRSEHHIHTTPWGSAQAFQFSVLRREPSSQT